IRLETVAALNAIEAATWADNASLPTPTFNLWASSGSPTNPAAFDNPTGFLQTAGWGLGGWYTGTNYKNPISLLVGIEPGWVSGTSTPGRLILTMSRYNDGGGA